MPVRSCNLAICALAALSALSGCLPWCKEPLSPQGHISRRGDNGIRLLQINDGSVDIVAFAPGDTQVYGAAHKLTGQPLEVWVVHETIAVPRTNSYKFDSIAPITNSNNVWVVESELLDHVFWEHDIDSPMVYHIDIVTVPTWLGVVKARFWAEQLVNKVRTKVGCYELFQVGSGNEYYEVWRAKPGVLPLSKDTWFEKTQDLGSIDGSWVGTIYRLVVRPQP